MENNKTLGVTGWDILQELYLKREIKKFKHKTGYGINTKYGFDRQAMFEDKIRNKDNKYSWIAS